MNRKTFLIFTCLFVILVISNCAFAAEITTTLVKERTQILVDNLLANITVGKEGAVIEVNNGEVYFNLGVKDGVKPGMQFDVFQEGQTLKDPTTGKILGKAKKTVGTIKVKSVEDGFSVASIVVLNNAKFQIAKGNIIKSKILKTVVLDFTQSTNQKTDENLPKFIQSNIIEGLNNTGKFILAERSEIQKVISELKLGVSGMIDASSAKQIGKQLGADVVILGFVANLGDTYEITARMVDVETGTIIGNSSVQLTGDVTKLADNVKTDPQIDDDMTVTTNSKVTQVKDTFFALNVDDDGNYSQKTDSYYTTDDMIYYYVSWHFNDNELNKSFKAVVKLYKPNGAFYDLSDIDTKPTDKDWVTWFPFYLKGYEPANTPGKWKAELYINGILTSTNQFMITEQNDTVTTTTNNTNVTQIKDTFFVLHVDQKGNYTHKTDVYYTTDEMIYYYVDWHFNSNELKKSYKAVVKLYKPNGDFYDSSDIDTKPTQADWVTWFPFYLKDHEPANNEGKWKAELYVNGSLADTKEFSITASALTGAFFLRYVTDDGNYDDADKATSFSVSTDKQIIYYTNWEYYEDELNKTYQLQAKLIDPSGKVYDTMDFENVPTENKWIVWFPFNASTKMAKGKWRAELYVDGAITNVTSFDVTK